MASENGCGLCKIKVDNIGVKKGGEVLLSEVSFHLHCGELTALIGVNGAGKSLLLKTIFGINKAESGEIFTGKDKKISYLEQNAGFESEKILFDEMLGAFSHLCEWEERLAYLQKKMNDNCPENEHMSYVKEYTSLEEKFRLNGGYEYKNRIKSMLTAVGFGAE